MIVCFFPGRYKSWTRFLWPHNVFSLWLHHWFQATYANKVSSNCLIFSLVLYIFTDFYKWNWRWKKMQCILFITTTYFNEAKKIKCANIRLMCAGSRKRNSILSIDDDWIVNRFFVYLHIFCIHNIGCGGNKKPINLNKHTLHYCFVFTFFEKKNIVFASVTVDNVRLDIRFSVIAHYYYIFPYCCWIWIVRMWNASKTKKIKKMQFFVLSPINIEQL